uniref:hypothetical protein n=1 Tax=Pseudonocardia lacus TaxID=2835865 RepID=UPI001BDC7E0C
PAASAEGSGPSAGPSAPPDAGPGRSASRRRSRSAGPPSTARRSLAVLGILGVLAGGYALSGSRPETPPVMAMVPVGMAPDFTADGEWATRAGAALASVDQQLVDLDAVEEAWEDTPAAQRDEDPPTAITELRDRREELERRRATLQAQLSTFAMLNRAGEEVRAIEASLRSVEESLAEAPREPESREQAAQVTALEAQRDQHQRRLEAGLEELRGLQEDVRVATRTPLPDDEQVTEEVRADALAAVEAGGGDVATTVSDRDARDAATDERDPDAAPR